MYAISTPSDDQYSGDGIAARGLGYGIPTIRVDGMDAIAVHVATEKAREIIMKEKKPCLIESISYRVGDHSTSDFSQLYRDEKEMEKWNQLLAKLGNPIDRLETFLVSKNVINEGYVAEFREGVKMECRDALKRAVTEPKASLDNIYNDVYDKMTPHLERQQENLKNHLRKYRDQYDLSMFKDNEKFL